MSSEDASYFSHQYNSTLVGVNADRSNTAYVSNHYNHVCPVSTVNATNVMVCFVMIWHQSIEWHTWGYYVAVFRGHIVKNIIMMTSSNGNIFRVTGPLCGEFTGPGEFPAQRPVTLSFDVFYDLRPNERLSKQQWGWWFETLSCSLWRHRNDWRSLSGGKSLNQHQDSGMDV